MPMNETTYDFRFSASYASRYHNCHGSARLEEAIPGFQHPEREDKGMKREGTLLHKLFQNIAETRKNFLEAAFCLEELADVWGPKRLKLIQSEDAYLIWWFMKHKTEPPVDWHLVKHLVWEAPKSTKEPDVMVTKTSAPLRLKFVAEALRYVQDIIDEMNQDSLEILIEDKVEATWLVSKPKTTVDLIVRDKHRMEVLDLKMGDIEVSPVMNEQLMYYAVSEGGLEYDKVRLHIVQRNNIDYWEVRRGTLQTWMAQVQESEALILAGDLTLKPGDHCKFCPANPHSRGDKGNKACPAMMSVLYGDRNRQETEQDVITEGEDW